MVLTRQGKDISKDRDVNCYITRPSSNQSTNMASNNNDNNLNNMPLELKDLITPSIKKDIVAMCNINCTSTSLSRVKHATPARRFLTLEIINECAGDSPDNICSICRGGIKRRFLGQFCNCYCSECGEHCDFYGCYDECNNGDIALYIYGDIVSLYPIFE